MIRRVLMTADAVGGVWTYALELARALSERNVAVLLAVMGPAPTAQRRQLAEQIPNLVLEHQPFALEWQDRPWAEVHQAGEWLQSLESRWRPDLVHLNGYVHASCNFEAPRVVVAHSCVCSWHQSVHGQAAPSKWATYRRKVRAGLVAADAVIAPTRWMLDQLEEHYGPQHHAEVIANARTATGFRVARKEAFVFAAGRAWDEAQNLFALDRAAKELAWPVMIAGATGQAQPFEDSHLLGELETSELSGWLARASIYALPAKYEPFGLSVLEAALSGCALVLGDLPSLRENWGDAAVFVDPREPAQLSATLRRLIEAPALRREWAGRALERAQKFTPRAQADAYLAAYESAAVRAGRPACAS